MPLLEVSDAKRAANQANAKHSTGPKSPEGKEKSRQNAVRHGLRSKLAVIEKLGETVQSNYVLKDLYLKRVNPGTPEELTQHITRNLTLWGDAVKRSGASVD